MLIFTLAMVLSDLLRILTFIMFAVSNSPWFDWPYITLMFFVVNNACSGLYSPASEAMLLDVSSPEERKYMYSVIYWITNLSTALGGMIGAYFFEEYLFELFIFLSLSSIVTTIITIFFITETYSPKVGEFNSEIRSNKLMEYKGILKNYRKVLGDRLFILFVLSSMLLFSLESHLTNFIAVRLENEIGNITLYPFDMELNGVKLLGLLRTENTILVVIFSLIATLIIRRYNDKRLIFIGFSMYILGYGILSFSNNPWILLIVMIFIVIGEVVAFPVQQSYLGNIVPNNLRSTYLALNRIAIKGSSFIGILAIYLASVLPSHFVSLLVWVPGIVALWIFYLILPAISERKKLNNIVEHKDEI